jgi:hypothetical protein
MLARFGGLFFARDKNEARRAVLSDDLGRPLPELPLISRENQTKSAFPSRIGNICEQNCQGLRE